MTLYILGYVTPDGKHHIGSDLMEYDDAKSLLICNIAEFILDKEGIDPDTSIEEIFKNDVIINKKLFLEKSREDKDGSLDISLMKKITIKGYIYNSYTDVLCCKFFIKSLVHKCEPSIETIEEEQSEQKENQPDQKDQEEVEQGFTLSCQSRLLEELRVKLEGGIGNYLNPALSIPKKDLHKPHFKKI